MSAAPPSSPTPTPRPPPEAPQAATVFFGHGLLFGGWMFRAQIAALGVRYRCVAIDWRGQGDSVPTAGGYDMDTLANDATALIGMLGVAPVHYVGLSMGGFVGQRLAARRSDLVRTLTGRPSWPIPAASPSSTSGRAGCGAAAARE